METIVIVKNLKILINCGSDIIPCLEEKMKVY